MEEYIKYVFFKFSPRPSTCSDFQFPADRYGTGGGFVPFRVPGGALTVRVLYHEQDLVPGFNISVSLVDPIDASGEDRSMPKDLV